MHEQIAGLAFAYYGRTSFDTVVAFIVPAAQLVLGVELASMLLLAGLVGAYHLGRRDAGPRESGQEGDARC